VEKQRKYHKMKKRLLSIFLIVLFVAGCAEEQATRSAASAKKTSRTQSLKPRATIILEKGLKSKSARLRSLAIKIVVETGQKDRLPHITRLTTDPVVRVRFAATIALGDIQCFSCEKIVRNLLNDPDVNVQIAAAYSLAKLNQPQFVEQIRAAAKTQDQTIRANAAMLLGELGNPNNIPLLYDIMTDSDSGFNVRINTVNAIARLGDEQMYRSKLWALLISKFPNDRVDGIQGMGALNSIESRDAIATMLQDDIVEVRLAAAEQLARLGDKRGEEQIYEYFKTPPDLNKAEVSNEMAVRAIGPLNSSRLNSFLPEALDSQSPYIQLLAARSVLLQRK